MAGIEKKLSKERGKKTPAKKTAWYEEKRRNKRLMIASVPNEPEF